MSSSDMVEKIDFRRFQSRRSLMPVSFFPSAASFVDVVKQAIPFYKQLDELLKRDVDFSNKKDVEIITKLLTSQDPSKKHIQVLKKAFGELKFFQETQQNLPPNEYNALIKELKYEKFEKYDSVFSYDDYGFKYYIILKGSVYVLIPNPETLKQDKLNESKQINVSKRMDQSVTTRKISQPFKRKTSVGQNNQIQKADTLQPPQIKVQSIDRRPSSIKQSLSIVVENEDQQLQTKQSIEIQKSGNKNSTQAISNFVENTQQESKEDLDSPGLKISELAALALLKSKSLSPQKVPIRRSTLTANAASGIKKLQMMLLKRGQTIEEEVEPEQEVQQTDQQIQDAILEQHLGFDIVKNLKVGDAFGEIALMNNARRTASIVCKEETILVTLTNYHQKKYMESVNFLKEFNLFSEWQNSKINALYQSMETRPTQYKEVIYREGENADFVYFIKEGEFEVTKTIKIESNDSPNSNSLNVLQKFNHNSAKQQEQRTAKITVFSAASSFGEEEIVMNSKRNCRVTCISSSGYLYILSKQNKIQWRENLQDKLIKTEKKFRESNNFLKPESFSMNDFKLRSIEQIPLQSDSDNEENVTATSPLHKKRSFLNISNCGTPSNKTEARKLSFMVQSGSQIFHQHPIEQILSVKEENARALRNTLKPLQKQSSPPHNDSPDKKNIPFIKLRNSSEAYLKPLTSEQSPTKKSIQVNALGQRISSNGHFVSSLTDLELDFTKLTIQQTKSTQIKNIIDPFYDPPKKSNLSNFKQNVTQTKFSPKKGYTQTKFINSNKSLPFINERISQQIASLEQDQESQQNEKSQQKSKDWQSLLKYTVQMSNVKNKESLFDLSNFRSIQTQKQSEEQETKDNNLMRVNSLKYSRNDQQSQDFQANSFQSPRNMNNNNPQISINGKNNSTKNFSITVSSFTNLNQKIMAQQKLKQNSVVFDTPSSLNKDEEFSPIASQSPFFSRHTALQAQSNNGITLNKFISTDNDIKKKQINFNKSCTSFESVMSQINNNSPQSTTNPPSAFGSASKIPLSLMKKNLGHLVGCNSSGSPNPFQKSNFNKEQQFTKSMMNKTTFNTVSGGGFKNDSPKKSESPKKNESFRIKVGTFNPIIIGSKQTAQQSSSKQNDIKQESSLSNSLRVNILPIN